MKNIELSILSPTQLGNGTQRIERKLVGEVTVSSNGELAFGVTCPEDQQVLAELISMWPCGGMSALTIFPYGAWKGGHIEVRVDDPTSIKIVQI